MNNNYESMQEFLDILKEFAISNPNNVITEKFVYSLLINFRTNNPIGQSERIDNNFEYWQKRFENNRRITVFETAMLRGFLFFSKGEMKGNEVKLYIPLDKEHVKEGANQLFDFIAQTGIEHQSKIARIVRNDDVVVRVNNLEDAKIVMDYVLSNQYLSEGMLKVNPFLPNYNGIGITMDNNFSFNGELSKLLAEFVEYSKNNNSLHLLNVENFNKYVSNSISKVHDLDLKDIYSLLMKTTSKNFKFQDFLNHSKYKLIDKYDDRERIVDPNYYFEMAIMTTEKFYPGNSKSAILEYLKSNPVYFTNKEKVREGLLKYVRPGDVIPLMRAKLSQKNIPIPSKDEELIDKYLSIVLNKQTNYYYQFDIIKHAYINTLSAYDEKQAKTAFKSLFYNNDVKYFTNRFGDRENLKKNVLTFDVRKIILSNIDTTNLNLNNIDEIYNRFVSVINQDYNKQNSY